MRAGGQLQPARSMRSYARGQESRLTLYGITLGAILCAGGSTIESSLALMGLTEARPRVEGKGALSRCLAPMAVLGELNLHRKILIEHHNPRRVSSLHAERVCRGGRS
jgi:hypothetical protein